MPKWCFDFVFIRGRTAKQWGEGKASNPYLEESPYHEIWTFGWKSANAPKTKED